jgi:aquaporin Z
MEAANLGFFMLSACVFTVLLEHPESPVNQVIENGFVRHILMGLAMGSTLLAIVHSPWGKRSGAHMNPALTWNFCWLGKIHIWDAVFYAAFQFAGGIAGVALAEAAIGLPLRHSAVNYAATQPGSSGPYIAFAAELVISFGMMLAVLVTSNSIRFMRYTPFFAAALVALYITFEAPYSGMSMNPARTLGSALAAGDFAALWVYFSAPLLGMFLAAAAYQLTAGTRAVFCAKLHHTNNQRCIFRCGYAELASGHKEY